MSCRSSCPLCVARACSRSSRTGIPDGWFRCQSRPCRECPPCIANNIDPCTGTIRRDAPSSARLARWDRGSAGDLGGCARRSPSAPAIGSSPRDTSLPSTARRCRQCHTSRTHSAGTGRRPSRQRGRPGSYRSPGSGPGACWPSICRLAGTRRPRQTVCLRARPAPRTPTRPRSADACRPTWHRPSHPRRQCARRDGSLCP